MTLDHFSADHPVPDLDERAAFLERVREGARWRAGDRAEAFELLARTDPSFANQYRSILNSQGRDLAPDGTARDLPGKT